MRFNWLNKQSNNKVIVFFNGWGMDDSVVRHLDAGEYDILTVCDYNELVPLPNLDLYKEKFVVAWSMGVMVATNYNINAISVTAVNGTPFSIHPDFGINPKVYKLMELGFNDQSRNKFIAKMFDTMPENFEIDSRTTEDQKAELTALKKYEASPNYKFNRAIVSKNDNIIPTKSQLNYWENPELVDGGHCIFFNYKSWEELL